LTKNLTKQQKEAIKGYVKKGYSANQIQVNLKNRHMGIRRKVLLAEVRRGKGQPSKAETVKYIPKKYARARWRARVKRIRLRPLGEKQVTLTGLHKGKLISKTQRGSGKELYRFVLDEMTGDYWDEKPHIHS
jgi:IS30 family transposase